MQVCVCVCVACLEREKVKCIVWGWTVMTQMQALAMIQPGRMDFTDIYTLFSHTSLPTQILVSRSS